MNSLNVEKQYQFSKWTEIIRSCKSSGMKVSEWLRQNDISKDKYYYWQRKIKDACLETLQMEQPTFVELPTVISQNNEALPTVKKVTIKNKSESVPEGHIPVATFKIGSINLDIYDNASPQFIKNLLEALAYVE